MELIQFFGTQAPNPEDRLQAASKPVWKLGVLLMAYGSPDRLEQLEDYLLDVRGGRPLSKEVYEEIRERYRLIGGRSPLLDLTSAQASALHAELNRRFSPKGIEFKVFVGMRHWEPRIRDAVALMDQDGIRAAVGLVMAPHRSQMTTGAYFSKLKEALQDLGSSIRFSLVESWHDHLGLIQSLAENANKALEKFSSAPFVLFTAHSLPKRILESGDPYDGQLRLTAKLLSRALRLPESQWGFCYQSAGQSVEPWLGPPIEEMIVSLAQSGEKNILVVPVGFVCDHVEILYDIDIAARELAGKLGVRLVRSESLNVSPLFIRTLADLVVENLPIQVTA